MIKMTEKQQKINEKIIKTKLNFTLLFSKFCYLISNGMKTKEILKQLGITYKTIQKWRKKWMITDKIKAVTLDRALKEMIFKKKEQIICFEYLQQDYNFWSSYKEVSKVVDISQYHFKQVKDYIMEEIDKKN